MRRIVRALAALAALLLLGVSTVAFGNGVDPADDTAPGVGLAAHFSLLREPPAVPPSDTEAIRPALARTLEVDAAQLRVVETPAGAVSVFVASDGLCVALGEAASCTEPNSALAGRTMLVHFCQSDLPAGVTRLAGVLPDGADDVLLRTDDGTSTALGLDHGVFGAMVQGVPVELRWVDADGQRSARVPVPHDAAELLSSCANAA